MLLATIRWKALADHLPEDIPQRVFEDDDIVHVLDILDDVLQERESWIQPASDRYFEVERAARYEGAVEALDGVDSELGALEYRRDLFGTVIGLDHVKEALATVVEQTEKG